ncbi:OmpP1/FadL family transporter [Rhodothermus profundi]|nr:outer membrane protein transport protein [Rhodothermus profundi]
MRYRFPFNGLCFLALLSSLLLSPSVLGQGFLLSPPGACTLGRGGTGVALPCADGSAMALNPAGIALVNQWAVAAGGTAYLVQGSFTDDYTRQETRLEERPVTVPHLFAAFRATSNLTIGFGAYMPYGLEVRWPRTFEGSFVSYQTRVQTTYLQPTLAFRLVEPVLVGAGPVLAVSTVSLWHQLDLAPVEALPGVPFAALGIPPGTPFANVKMESNNSYGLGGHVGLLVQVTDQFRIGIRYLTPIRVRYSGMIRFTPLSTGIIIPTEITLNGQTIPAGAPLDAVLSRLNLFDDQGPLANRDIETELTMPAQFVAGFSWKTFPGITLLFDYQWTGWATFDQFIIEPVGGGNPIVRIQDYRNTHTFRTGLLLQANSILEMRLGYTFAQGAAPSKTVTPLLPEASRNLITLGTGWRLGRGVMLDLAYQYVRQDDRRGRVIDPPPGTEPSPALNSGLYQLSAHVVSLTVSVSL